MNPPEDIGNTAVGPHHYKSVFLKRYTCIRVFKQSHGWGKLLFIPALVSARTILCDGNMLLLLVNQHQIIRKALSYTAVYIFKPPPASNLGIEEPR